MTQEDIYRIALYCFNISWDKKKTTECPEATLPPMYLRSAELAAARLHEWSFLQKRYKYSEDEMKSYEPVYGKLSYIYDAPTDMLSPLTVNGEYNHSIRIIGTDIIFDVKDPELTYISNKVDYKRFPYPEDYGYLIAYELAYEIADQLMPEKAAVKSGIAQKIEMKAQLIRKSDLEGLRDENVVPEWMVY